MKHSLTKAGADFGDFGRKLENLGLPVTSLRENLHQAHLDCLIFVQRNKNYSGFARDATHKPATHHLNGQLISIVLCNQQRLTPFYIKLRPYLLKIY